MDSGVKVVGAESSEEPETASGDDAAGAPPKTPKGRSASAKPDPARRRLAIVSAVAVLGVVGTLVFGVLWGTAGGSGQQDPAVISSARAFLTDLTNFNAKTVDADFSSVTAMKPPGPLPARPTSSSTRPSGWIWKKPWLRAGARSARSMCSPSWAHRPFQTTAWSTSST